MENGNGISFRVLCGMIPVFFVIFFVFCWNPSTYDDVTVLEEEQELLESLAWIPWNSFQLYRRKSNSELLNRSHHEIIEIRII